jgi:hypothetical protein
MAGPKTTQIEDAAARQRAERLASEINWEQTKAQKPPQEWFDDRDNPFEPEETSSEGEQERASQGQST